MTDDDLAYLSIRDLEKHYRARSLSPVDVTRALLARIEGSNATTRAFITVFADQAIAQARDAEREIARGACRGPLHGIPVSIKDLFDMRGVATTAASRILKDSVAENDSALVERLRAAGAVILGKNNLHEFAYGTTCTSSLFGSVRNPWDPTRMAGGSSGGSATAVAAGQSYASIGTDTGGSIRIPASLCGVVGLKPTYGLVSRRGLLPLAPSLDHVGPFGRDVADIAAVLQVIAGRDPGDPACAANPVPDYGAAIDAPLRGLRVGILETTLDVAHMDSRNAVRGACDAFAEAGVILEDAALESIEVLREAAYTVLFSEAAATHWERLKERPDDFFPDVLERLERAKSISGADYVRALETRELGRARAAELFARFDVLVSPLFPMGAPHLDAESVTLAGENVRIAAATTTNTREWNLIGNPALCLPCGFDREGLPLGLQLVGRPFDEATLLRVGAGYQRATHWHKERPPALDHP